MMKKVILPIKFSPKRHVFDKEKQPERLKIHFIDQLKEYKYGLQMFRKFERYGNGKLIKAVEMESQAQ